MQHQAEGVLTERDDVGPELIAAVLALEQEIRASGLGRQVGRLGGRRAGLGGIGGLGRQQGGATGAEQEGESHGDEMLVSRGAVWLRVYGTNFSSRSHSRDCFCQASQEGPL